MPFIKKIYILFVCLINYLFKVSKSLASILAMKCGVFFSHHTQNIICVWLASLFSLCMFNHEVTQQEIYTAFTAFLFSSLVSAFSGVPNSEEKIVHPQCILINAHTKYNSVSQILCRTMCVVQQALRFRMNSSHHSKTHYILT